MLRSNIPLVFGGLLGIFVSLAGCNKPVAKPPVDEHVHTEAGAADAATAGGANNEILEALAGLDAADRELALAQKVCPVSSEPLGSMGEPYKMNVEGKTVFLCCEACKGAVEQDPEGILAKLGK